MTPSTKPRLLRVRDWAGRLENSRTRELRTLAWVPIPTDLSGDLYAAIMDHPDGAAHFAVSVTLHIVASKSYRGGYSSVMTGAHTMQNRSGVSRACQNR